MSVFVFVMIDTLGRGVTYILVAHCTTSFLFHSPRLADITRILPIDISQYALRFQFLVYRRERIQQPDDDTDDMFLLFQWPILVEAVMA